MSPASSALAISELADSSAVVPKTMQEILDDLRKTRLVRVERPDEILDMLTPYHWVGTWSIFSDRGAMLFDERYFKFANHFETRPLSNYSLITEPAQVPSEVTGRFIPTRTSDIRANSYAVNLVRTALPSTKRFCDEADFPKMFGYSDWNMGSVEMAGYVDPREEPFWVHEARSPVTGKLFINHADGSTSPPGVWKLRPAFKNGSVVLDFMLVEKLRDLFREGSFAHNLDAMMVDPRPSELPESLYRTD